MTNSIQESSAPKTARLMISYSRKDKSFVKKLYDSLVECGFVPDDIWVDWEGIPLTADWMAEITKGIQSASVFIFVISPDSIVSEVCQKEIAIAAEGNKRFIPILYRDPAKGTPLPEKISSHNWIFIQDEQQLEQAMPALVEAINTDLDWIAQHTRLFMKAKEWEGKGRNESYLLRGSDLNDAEMFISEGAQGKKPSPTSLHIEYVQAARTHAAAVRRRNQIIAAVVGVVLVALTIFAFIQRNDARKQAELARVRELATRVILERENRFRLSLLLGLEIFDRMPDLLSTRGVMLNNAQANPQLIQYLSGHAGFVNTVAFAPDGRTLASGAGDNTIILWDVATHRRMGQPLTTQGAVYGLAFSPDGKTLASGLEDNTIILWDMTSGQPIGEPLAVHSGPVWSVAFNADGTILASASADGTIILWDVAKRQPLGDPLAGHEGVVWKLAFSPDGRTLASGGADSTVILWDVATHTPLVEPLAVHGDIVYTVNFSPDGKILASGGEDSTIILWDMETYQPIGDPLSGESGVYSIVFSPDGNVLASGNADNSITLWDVALHEPVGDPLRGHSNWVNSVAFSPDGQLLASGAQDNMVILWDMVTQQSLKETLTLPSAVYSVAFSPDGKTLASGVEAGPITLWDLETSQETGKPLEGHSAEVWRLAIHPDGNLLASAGGDNVIILWDLATHEAVGEPLSGHNATVWSVTFSPDGKTLASGSTDNTIILWDVATRQPVGEPIDGHEGTVWNVNFSPDGKTIVSSGNDGNVILWDVTTGQMIGAPFTGHDGAVYNVVFSPDGKTIASGGDDGTVRIWDIAAHQPVGDPMPANSAVYSLAFSPDGKTLASGTLNGSVILWDTALRQPIGEPLTGHGNWINSVAFSPDGKTLASAGADSIVILWNVDPQAWVDHSCQRAGSNFTRDEWAVHFPDEEYHQTCDMWLLESEQPLVVEAVTETQVQEMDTATVQPVSFTATAEATQSAESTPALATLPVEDLSFYTEEFDGSFDPWHSFMTTGIERQVNMGIDNGSLALQLKPFEDKVPRFYLTNEAFDYTDVQVEVVVTNNGNNANGVSVICRYSDRGWYEFRLSNAGLYSIDSYDPSMKTYTELASGGSSAIKTGHATNVYTAICKGQELSIHVNGIPIKTITDTKFNLTEGKIGIGVSSPQTLPVDIQFESVTVSKPE